MAIRGKSHVVSPGLSSVHFSYGEVVCRHAMVSLDVLDKELDLDSERQ